MSSSAFEDKGHVFADVSHVLHRGAIDHTAVLRRYVQTFGRNRIFPTRHDLQQPLIRAARGRSPLHRLGRPYTLSGCRWRELLACCYTLLKQPRLDFCISWLGVGTRKPRATRDTAHKTHSCANLAGYYDGVGYQYTTSWTGGGAAPRLGHFTRGSVFAHSNLASMRCRSHRFFALHSHFSLIKYPSNPSIHV